MEATTVRFAVAARTLGRVARAHDLTAPGFRSPPRLERADRSIRRRGERTATVAVRLRGRPWPAVLADMIEGVVAANALEGPAADEVRSRLWDAMAAAEGAAATAESPSRRRVRAVPAPRAA